jgi:rhodanese-related sulfurtransferase
MASSDIARLSVEDVEKLVNTSDAQLVDVRPPFDYFGGRVPGALNLPATSVVSRAAQVSKDRKLVFIDDDGQGMSLEAAQAALDSGLYTEGVAILEGGYDAWLDADKPTETISEGIQPTPVKKDA